jgi:hypothetical protein
VILVVLHLFLILGVGLIWNQSVRQFGGLAGPKANAASKAVRWFDFPANWLSERGIEAVLSSKAPSTVKFAQWMGINTLTDSQLRLYWPLLFLLGSMQWFLIGLVIERLKGTVRKT